MKILEFRELLLQLFNFLELKYMFKDITLVEVVQDMTTKPDERKELFNVYFKLSETPDYIWTNIFEKVHKNRFHTMLRKAYVEGGYIVVYCGLDEVQKYQIGILKKDLEETNKYYKDYLEKEAQRLEKEKLKSEATQKEIQEKLGNISIDD